MDVPRQVPLTHRRRVLAAAAENRAGGPGARATRRLPFGETVRNRCRWHTVPNGAR